MGRQMLYGTRFLPVLPSILSVTKAKGRLVARWGFVYVTKRVAWEGGKGEGKATSARYPLLTRFAFGAAIGYRIGDSET